MLRGAGREYRIARSPLVMGRSSSCDIQVESSLVSRQHARLTLTNLGVLVEDLGSRNGVFLNSQRIRSAVRMKNGDSLTIGDETFILTEVEEPLDITQSGITLVGSARDSRPDEDRADATRHAHVFQLLGGVVDKALALGRGEEAERIIGAHLTATLRDASGGRRLSPDLARSAASYALKLANATNKASWVDYTLRLYHVLELALPLALVDELYTLLRRVRGVDLALLREYTDALRARAETLTPAERFVLQRMSGLERLAAWQTNNSF